jgi:hypothetical protein
MRWLKSLDVALTPNSMGPGATSLVGRELCEIRASVLTERTTTLLMYGHFSGSSTVWFHIALVKLGGQNPQNRQRREICRH